MVDDKLRGLSAAVAAKLSDFESRFDTGRVTASEIAYWREKKLEMYADAQERLRYGAAYGVDLALLEQQVMAHYTDTKHLMKEHMNMQAQTECKPINTVGRMPLMPPMPSVTPESRVEQAKAALEHAEAVLAAENEKREFDERIQYQIDLAAATYDLLHAIRAIEKHVNYVQSLSEQRARFKKELSPLAAEWGYKIVLIGDRSKAMLVQK